MSKDHKRAQNGKHYLTYDHTLSPCIHSPFSLPLSILHCASLLHIIIRVISARALENGGIFFTAGYRQRAKSPGDSHMKQTGMLVVSLRGENFGFWSLRVLRAKRQYFMPPWSRLGFREETQNYAKRNRSQIFLRCMAKNYFQIRAFDAYVFMSLKLSTCHICVALRSFPSIALRIPTAHNFTCH